MRQYCIAHCEPTNYCVLHFIVLKFKVYLKNVCIYLQKYIYNVAGLYSVFCLHCIDIRHGVFFFHTRTLVAVCC